MSESILFQQNILVVNQKAKLIELTNQYSVFYANGNTVGHVNQVGQSNVKKLLRLVSSVDQFLTHHFDITDSSGALVMSITRPAKIFKSTVLINDSTGAELGRIVQENVFGKIHFALEVGGVSPKSLLALLAKCLPLPTATWSKSTRISANHFIRSSLRQLSVLIRHSNKIRDFKFKY